MAQFSPTGTNKAPTGSVLISGTPIAGTILTASNSLADADGLGPIAYQWNANGIPIDGATASSLLLTVAEVGKAISVTASYTDGGGTAESVATALVASTPTPPASPGRSGGEYRNAGAFAALKADGSVVTWGNSFYGGIHGGGDDLSSGVIQIFSSELAFAALKDDGSVVTWGDSRYGGDSSGVAGLSSGVTRIFSSYEAFAALKDDGSVVTWGKISAGGDSRIFSTFSSFASQVNGVVVSWGRISAGGDSSAVSQIFSAFGAFAALKDNGSVVSWGSLGGDSSGVADSLRSGVIQIFSTQGAFAALKNDGSVVTWGYRGDGGDSSGVDLSSGVSQIFSTDLAFAALKSDGSVVTWGESFYGGDSRGVANSLRSGVVQIFSTRFAFAALKADGSVVTWGDSDHGGDSSRVDLSSGVTQIFSTDSAFAALKADGSVVTWGFGSRGGDSSGVTGLSSGVRRIFSTNGAFAALKDDGSVVTWGADLLGGDSSGVDLSSGVTQIFSTDLAFAAFKSDGSVITWGNSSFGGNSSAVADSLRSGVVGMANPFTDDMLLFVEQNPNAPTITSSASASVPEDSSGIVYQATASDPNAGTTLSWTLGGSDAALFTIDSSTGAVSFNTPPNFEAPQDSGANNVYDIIVTASDGILSSMPRAVAINVIDVNYPPTITSGESADFEENSGGIVYRATATDPEGTTSFFWTLVGVDAARFTIDSFGAVRFKASPNFEAPLDAGANNVYDITVTATDESISSDPKAITISVTNANDRPTGSVLISGTPIVGNTLRASNTLADIDGLGPIAYQWSSGGIPIAGATASTLLLTQDEVGKAISVTASYTDEDDTEESVSTALVATTPIPQVSPGRSGGEYRNIFAFAALKDDGSVVTWGADGFGGDSSGVDLSSGVIQIFSNTYAFAALKDDGSVITWGSDLFGGDSSGVDLSSGVTQIFSTYYAFAALKNDGSVVAWGDGFYGGDSSVVAGLSSGVNQIFSTFGAFAALKADGSVVTWGGSFGGDSSDVADSLRSGVVQIFSTESAFAALKDNGSVVTWGDSTQGGDSSGVADSLNSGIIQIFSTDEAFAALKDNGSVVTWGNRFKGGDSSEVDLSSGVRQIFSSERAFAALKDDGLVVTWGDSRSGGDSSGVAGLSSGVIQIFSTDYAFAALKADGSVVTWGDSRSGGDSSGVAGLNSGVIQIFSTNNAFAALKNDGSVITWGSNLNGGDSSGVAGLSSGVRQIFSTDDTFAALKDDGSVVTWRGGIADYISAVADSLRSGVVGMANPFTDDVLLFVEQSSVPPNNPPTITSGATASVPENSTGVVYQATASDPDAGTTLSWSLGGSDAALFSINRSSGAVSFQAPPNFEAPQDSGANNVYDISVTANDGSLSSAAKAVAISVTNVNDNDSAGISVSPTSGLVTTESGGTAGFSVVLDSQPTADVVIGLASSDITEGTLSTSSLTFTAANWNVAQIVTVTGVDDAIVDGNIDYTVVTAAAVSTDNNYNGLNAADVSISNVNNDASILVGPTPYLSFSDSPFGSLSLTQFFLETFEDGLLNAPGVEITNNTPGGSPLGVVGPGFTIDSVDADDGLIDGLGRDGRSFSSLSNESTGNFGYTISFSSSTLGAFPTYAGLVWTDGSQTAPTLFEAFDAEGNSLDVVGSVKIGDNSFFGTTAEDRFFGAHYSGGISKLIIRDPGSVNSLEIDHLQFGFDVPAIPRIIVTPTSGLVTTENGGTASFSVVLDSQSTADVVIGLASSDITEGTLSTSSLTFTAANWNVAQIVTVTGVDDAIVDGNIPYTIVTAAAVSTDGNYNGLNAADVSVTNTDNDNAGISVSPTSGLVTTESGGGRLFDVNLIVNGGVEADEGSTGSAIVPITGFNTTGNFTAVLYAAGGGFPSVSDPGPVNRGFNFFAGGPSNNFSSASQLIDLTSGAASIDLGTVSFNLSAFLGGFSSQGDNAALKVDFLNSASSLLSSVKLGPVATGERSSLTGLLFRETNGTLPIGTRFASVTLEMSRTEGSYNDGYADNLSLILRGPAASFTVVLNSQPTADVTIGLSSDDITEGTLSTPSLTFTSVNWNTPQIVTVTGVDDAIVDGNIPYTVVTAAAVSTDGNYNGLNAADVSVTNNDNDTVVITSGGSSSVPENSSGTVYQATASDPDAGTTLSWSLGGADAALFTINRSSGAVSFQAPPNFEAPQDSGGNNVYDISVTANDGSLSSAAKAVAISVTNANEAPTITSGATASVPENITGVVYQATASDPDAGTTLSWSLGGADAALFTINSTTGAVSFQAPPNFEAPQDSGANNVYDISVTATDGSLSSAAKAVAISVTNVNEAPTGSVVISGTPIKGNTLIATNNLADADGLGSIVYQWRANGIPIAGATASSLLLTDAQIGKAISVTASYTDQAGTAESVSTALVASMPTPQASPGRSGGEYKNSGAFAALKDDGSVITWGLSFYGGDSSGVDLSGGVNQIFSTNYAFAALKDDGSVITWGHSSYGGDSSGVDLRSGVRQIFSTPYAFAALKDDGSVVSWGFRSYGGNSSGVDFSSGVSQIFSTNAAFAALKNDGSVVTWGDSHVGGNSSGVDFSSGVKQIFSTTYAFAALKTNGSVVSWGLSFYGGNSSGVADRLSSGVSQIFSTTYAFAALKDNGSVVTWGSSNYGGNSSSVADRLSSGVTQIFSTTYAFAALKANGSVVTWGDSTYGGNSSGVADRLSSGVSQIFSNTYAFAALKADGSVVSWGNSSYGGDSSLVAGLNSGVRQIFSTNGAFAALKADGSVITWGNNRYGGNSSGVAGLSSGVVQIFSTDSAFAAIKDDGSVITWGNNLYGGNSNGVAGLRSRVVVMANPLTDDDLLFVQQSSSVQPNNLQRSSLPTIPSGDSSLSRAFAAADASPYTVIPVMIQDSFDTGVAPTQTVTIASVRENTAPIEVVVAEGRRTHDTSPTITGTLSTPLGEGESLWLTNGSTLLVDGVVDNAARTWSATLALTTDGTYTITARVVDAAGSTVALSASRSFHLDTTAPRQTVAISAINANTGTITGPLANGAITNDTTPSLTGTLSGALATAEVLRIYSNGAFVGHGVVSGTNWSYTLATPLSANGSTVFTAQVIDAAGNSGPLSEPRSIVLDAPISSAAQDTLIGTVGAADIYRLPQLSLSLLGPAAALTYDTITNFEASDHLQVSGRSFRSWLTTSSGTAAGLDPSQLVAVLPADWSANSARAFKVSGFDGTFVALNDGLAGFQSDQDAILFFSSYNPSANTPIVIL